jgi:hypothetical protein
LDTDAKGTLSDDSIVSGPVASVTSTLQAIIFTPAENRVAVGDTETTTFTLTVNDGTGDTNDSTTTVVSTSINDAPTITGADISIPIEVGETLTASPNGYDDVDFGSDTPGTHLYQWHTGTSASCADKTDLSGANSDTYTITNGEIDKYLCVTLTPKDSDGGVGTPETGTTSTAVPKLDQTITNFNPPANKTYGDSTFTLTATSGASSNDVVFDSSTTPVCTVATDTVTINSAGTCTLTADEAADATYNIAPTVNGTVTIAKADITATAEDKTRAYGDSNPSFTSTYTGLVNGDTAPSTPPTLATTANASTAVGTATISCTAATDTNYNTTTCNDGTLTITKANTTTTINSDNADPSLIGQSITVDVSVASNTSGTPTGTVIVGNDGNGNTCDVTLSSGTGTCDLTPANGNTTLTATYAGDTNFNGSSKTEAHASLAAGISVDVGDGISLTEGGTTDTYTLTAFTAPASAITITITADAQTQVSSDGSTFAETATITINDTTAHTITVKAIDDSTVEGVHSAQITHAITAGDSGDYATSLSISPVDASISDNDHGVLITQTSGSTSVTEGGATDSFEVVLSTKPTSPPATRHWLDYLIQQAVAIDLITVTVSLNVDNQATLDNTSLNFNETNWNQPQTVTVTAVDDNTVEGSHNSTITLSASSDDDPNYSGATFVVDGTEATSLSVSITDNDSAPLPSIELSVSANAGTEAATTAITVTATASSAVTGDQTVNVAASGTGITSSDYNLSGTTITILDGQTTGTATFTIAEDSEVEGTETATLTISSPSAGITLGSTTTQNVSITDNDSASSSPSYYNLTVTKNDNGTVTGIKENSNSSVINCGNDCNERLTRLTVVTLTATPDKGWKFNGWTTTGICTTQDASNDKIEVIMGSDRPCQANFILTPTHTLTISGVESGTVSSTPAGIQCGTNGDQCSHDFEEGEPIELSVQPDDGLDFDGWEGDCESSYITLLQDSECQPKFVKAIATCPDTTRLYVNRTATGQNTGCSWSNAAINLQTALQKIGNEYPNVTEVWIAKGTYSPSESDRSASFQLINNVSIYGGFEGNEVDNEHKSSKNLTILSGDIGTQDDNSDNSLHVVTGSGTDATAVLKGVSISGGNADKGDVCPDACGGGIYIDNGSPTLKHIFVQENSAIYGGGIYSGNGSSPLIKESMINKNSAQDGGGLFNDNSSPNITHVFITGNTADQGGGMRNLNQANALLSRVNLSGNTAELGGGMLNDESAPVVSHSIFSDNDAENGGGLVNQNQSNPLLSHLIISGNFASNTGGAILNRDSAPVISQSTITENIAPNGSGIVNENSPITVNNSISWGNHNQDGQVDIQIVDDPAAPSAVNYSIIQGGWTGFGEHNLATDPLFAEPVTDHISMHSSMGDFHLKVHQE